MGLPILCAGNLFVPPNPRDVLIQHSGQQPNFPVNFAWSNIETEAWIHNTSGQAVVTLDTLSQKEADYWMIRGVFDSAVLQTSSDGQNYLDVGPAVSGHNKVLLSLFGSITTRYWRFVINRASAPPEVQHLWVGQKLEIPRGMSPGFSPHALSIVNNSTAAVTQLDQFLGATETPGKPTARISLDYLPAEWVREQWRPFIARAYNVAVVFSWDHDNDPGDAIFGWIPTQTINATFRQTRHYMQLRFDIKGDT
ncbi:MAG: hypothetical protein COB61_004260 [Thiotrichales bacterium]|nr:hypothetical protein [Thiotrichales bacterium]